MGNIREYNKIYTQTPFRGMFMIFANYQSQGQRKDLNKAGAGRGQAGDEGALAGNTGNEA